MFTVPKLYVGGIHTGWRALGRGCRRSRKELSIRKSQPPLRVAFRARANVAPTAREGESEEGCQGYIAALSSMVYFQGRYCGGEGRVRGAVKVWLRCG